MWNRLLLTLCALWQICMPSVIWAADWYDIYQDAKEAVKDKDYATAITLFRQVIAMEPVSAQRKRYGTRLVAYYPYVELGMAYIASGDENAAYEVCTQAQKAGIEPNDVIEQCLFWATIRRVEVLTPTPTLTPVPTPTAPPALPTPSLTPTRSPVERLLAEADIAFRQKCYLTCEQGNAAVALYQQVLQLEPANAQAKERLYKMMNDYKTWGDTELQKKNMPMVRLHYTHYQELAILLQSNFTDPTLAIAIKTAQNMLTSIQATPTPSLTFTPLPTPPPLLTPTPVTEAFTPTPETIFPMPMPTMTPTAFVPTATPTSRPTVPPTLKNTYALMIGISAYQDQRLNIGYAAHDAQGLSDLLLDPNYGNVPRENMTLLQNEQATTLNIKKAGTWLRQNASAEDIVLIYYAGHGAPEEDETYWVTYEADINDLYATALSNTDVADMLSRIRSQYVILLLDSSYTTAIAFRTNQTRGVSAQIPFERFAGPGRVIMSASDGTQKPLEESGYGVFAYYLLEGLRGKADRNRDYLVDVSELWMYVEYQVLEAARKAGSQQTPILQGAIPEGVALAFDQQAYQAAEEKNLMGAQIRKLQTLFEQQEISPEHFECGVSMLENHTPNRYLESLLDGKISAKVFEKFFKCEGT